MNERIKQLAEQADDMTDDIIQMPGEYHPNWHDIRDEKFAELIVRECAKVADGGWADPGHQIKQHFEVE